MNKSVFKPIAACWAKNRLLDGVVGRRSGPLLMLGLLASAAATPLLSVAHEACKPGRPTTTPKGDLVLTKCVDADRNPTRNIVALGEATLLESTYLSEQDFNAQRTKWILRAR